MEFLEKICTKNSRYMANQKLSPVGVVLHSIGCPQPNAAVLQGIWARNESPYVTHYVLDDVKAIHCMPNDRRCWHVGSPGNAKWLGVEMCEPKGIKYTTGASFKILDRDGARAYCKKTYANAVQLLARLCKQYGWDPATDIITHCEITRKKLSKTDHTDPEHLWNGLGLDYSLAGLRRDVAAAMEGKPAGSAATTNQQPAKQPATLTKLDAAQNFNGSKKGTYKVKASNGLRLRAGASTNKAIIETIPNGSTVRCYGYYTGAWLYVVSESCKIGFCHSDYLVKV